MEIQLAQYVNEHNKHGNKFQVNVAITTAAFQATLDKLLMPLSGGVY